LKTSNFKSKNPTKFSKKAKKYIHSLLFLDIYFLGFQKQVSLPVLSCKF